MIRKSRPEDILSKDDFKYGYFTVNNQTDVPYEWYLRIIKAKYGDDYDAWKKVNIKHVIMEPLADMVRERWDNIEPITPADLDGWIPTDVRMREHIKEYIKTPGDEYREKIL